MNKKKKWILIILDIISIILGVIELFTCLLIFKYGTNQNMNNLFITISIITFIIIIESITSIKKEKNYIA